MTLGISPAVSSCSDPVLIAISRFLALSSLRRAPAHRMGSLLTASTRLTLDRLARFVPIYGLLADVRFVGHVASERGVMSEDCIFDNGLSGLYGLEKIPQMRLHVVEIGTLEGNGLRHRLLA